MSKIKDELMKKCIESIHNSTPDLMEDKTIYIELSNGVTLVLDVKYVQASKLRLVQND